MPLLPVQFFQDGLPVPSQQLLTAWPVGSIYLSVVSTNPATLFGFGTWESFGDGRVPVSLAVGDPDFGTVEQTGGAKTVAAAGANSAPDFTGTSANTSAVSAGTPAGTVAAPAFTGTPGTIPAQTITWPVGVPTFSGTPFSAIINHVHTIQMDGSATPATTGTHIVNSTAAGGSSRTAASPNQANNPAGGVASITPAGTVAWPAGVPTNGTVNFTPAGTNSAPAFTGSALATHQHTLVATGTVAAPTFTGAPTSVVQPYIVVYMWKRTA